MDLTAEMTLKYVFFSLQARGFVPVMASGVVPI